MLEGPWLRERALEKVCLGSNSDSVTDKLYEPWTWHPCPWQTSGIFYIPHLLPFRGSHGSKDTDSNASFQGSKSDLS